MRSPFPITIRFQLRNRRLSRSTGGDVFVFILLTLGAAFMALPLVFAISNAFKPLNELFIFPPQFFVRHPTLNNFHDLFVLMAKSWVPMSRYLFNSLLIVGLGIIGNVFLGSLAAYALSKHDFPGKKILNEAILLSLMFAGAVTLIPNYMTISFLGWMDTYWAVIIPSWASTLGLYLLKNFIDAMVHDSLLEAAKIDGANEWQIYSRVVMPIVKPAWLTLIIIVFQQLWGTTGDLYLYSEQLKPLPYALSQIMAGGVARAGVASAVTLILMAVPITVFVINQSQIVQTMGASGITGE